MTDRRRAAIDRSRITREAKPLAELIGKMAQAKREGKDPYNVTPPAVPSRPPTRRKPKSQPENEVKNACLRWLHERGIFAWRNNTGMAWIGDHPIRFGLKGSADIIGLLPDGRFLAVEAKAASGRQSPDQKTFEENVRKNNGVYVLAYDVTDLEEALRDSA